MVAIIKDKKEKILVVVVQPIKKSRKKTEEGEKDKFPVNLTIIIPTTMTITKRLITIN